MAAALIEAFRFPRLALHHRDILGAFVVRDVKARYEGSMLGRLWPFLQPLLLLAVFGFVFSVVLNRPPASSQARVSAAWVTVFFMLSGILPWINFNESVQRCAHVVVENSNLIKKVAFPSELLPTYIVAVGLVQLLIGLALFVPVYVVVMLTVADGDFASRLSLLSGLAWLPAPLALQMLFTLGLGMLIAASNVYVRDIGQMLPLAMLILQFLSPVFYRVDAIAGQAPEWVLAAARANPLYHLLALWRGVFSYEAGQPFPLDSLAIAAGSAVGMFLLGFCAFRSWKGGFADEV